MKFLKKLFSRTVIVLLALLIQIFIYVVVVSELAQHYFNVAVVFTAIGVASVFGVINRDMSASYKVPWIILLLTLPIAGVVIYLLIGNPVLSKRVNKFQLELLKRSEEFRLPCPNTLDSLAARSELAAGQARYLTATCGMPLCDSTQTKYFPSGEAAFEFLKERLRQAKKYIFMEYFIIENGKMWGEILQILKSKAQEGVEVKVMYDDFGCSGRLKYNYCNELKKFGIECVKFNKLTFIVTAMHNNRDHRKITVIDGEEAFTGGFNLCDEYINVTSPFGYWKDSGIYLSGKGARNFAIMFLMQFALATRNNDVDFAKYLPESLHTRFEDGYVLPFGDGPAPMDNDYIAEETYLNIINQAKRYVYITTPYLIVDYHFTKALKAAAKRGVDVRIITPGVPDKKLVNIMTKSSYDKLTAGGVKIYEFTPGFIHAKSFVSDDTTAVIGTINLDYRSFVHHFECGVWMYGCSAVDEIRSDFDNTLQSCKQIERGKALKWYQRIVATVLNVFAPLM